MLRKKKPMEIDFICDLCEKKSDRLYIVQKIIRGRMGRIVRRNLGEYCGDCVKKTGDM